MLRGYGPPVSPHLAAELGRGAGLRCPSADRRDPRGASPAIRCWSSRASAGCSCRSATASSVRDLARARRAAAGGRRAPGPRDDQPHAADAGGRRAPRACGVAGVVLTPWPDAAGRDRALQPRDDRSGWARSRSATLATIARADAGAAGRGRRPAAARALAGGVISDRDAAARFRHDAVRRRPDRRRPAPPLAPVHPAAGLVRRGAAAGDRPRRRAPTSTTLDGNAYIDGVSSLWCNVHGHRHPGDRRGDPRAARPRRPLDDARPHPRAGDRARASGWSRSRPPG